MRKKTAQPLQMSVQPTLLNWHRTQEWDSTDPLQICQEKIIGLQIYLEVTCHALKECNNWRVEFTIPSWNKGKWGNNTSYRVLYQPWITYINPFSLWHFSSVFLIKLPNFLKKRCPEGLAVVPGPLVSPYSLHNASALAKTSQERKKIKIIYMTILDHGSAKQCFSLRRHQNPVRPLSS